MGKFNNILDLTEDETAETEGVELAFGKGRFITILRAGAGNRKYKSAMARVFKPYISVNGSISASDEEATELLKEVYAESIVIGWRGFQDTDDAEIPFNKQNCIELFDASPEIFSNVQEQAGKFSNFARREVDDAGKELPIT